jgi:hypothetical protein
MASGPRYPYWIEEASPTCRGPTVSRALFLFALLALALVALLGGPQATADGGGQVVHQVDSPACAERDRLAGHGVRSGPSYRRAASACARSLAP